MSDTRLQRWKKQRQQFTVHSFPRELTLNTGDYFRVGEEWTIRIDGPNEVTVLYNYTDELIRKDIANPIRF